MRIVQVVPEVRTGSGVEAVAHHLEQEWQKLGIQTERFTLTDALGSWLPTPGPGLRGKLTVIARVVWFSTVGTALGKAKWGRPDPDTVVICHNDALVGDVYVNHGLVAVAMKARGHGLLRMLRNPLHVFTYARDAFRFASRTHLCVVNLTSREDSDLRSIYPAVRPRTVVIGNGVDLERYTPARGDRSRIRSELGLAPDATVAVFVGHEFGRKGLPAVIESMASLDAQMHLLVVGGTADMVRASRAHAQSLGVESLVHFVGTQPDPRPYFDAADVFVFPSLYESYGLVVTEALASGLPVIATPTGCAPDVIEEGSNGFLTAGTPRAIADGFRRFLQSDRARLRTNARESALALGWERVAQEYLRLFERVLEERRR